MESTHSQMTEEELIADTNRLRIENNLLRTTIEMLNNNSIIISSLDNRIDQLCIVVSRLERRLDEVENERDKNSSFELS